MAALTVMVTVTLAVLAPIVATIDLLAGDIVYGIVSGTAFVCAACTVVALWLDRGQPDGE
jgi:hypothetical protein